MIFSRLTKIVVLLSLLIVGTRNAQAFSLMGPLTPWMQNGVLPQYPPSPGGGPMNIGEAYRWNVPVITYACDSSFLNYFGTNGVYAIEQAAKILNDLPTASELDINKYPNYSTRLNYRASSLLLLDVKSMALWMMLQAIGTASPERYVWTMRDLTHDPGGTPFFNVIKRNFDPVTWEPSSYVNGTFYSYYVRYTPPSPGPETATAVPVLVDPLAHSFTTVASGSFGLGEFYTGLTRDDVGCIKYIYDKRRAAIEVLTNVAAVTGITFTPGSSGTSSGWVIPIIGTNSTDIGSVDPTMLLGTSSGWVPVNITNSVSTNTTGTGGTVTTTTTNTYVSLALRAGVDKLTFTRMQLDSVYGFYKPVTNLYTDTYITNGISVRQVLQRSITLPDMVIVAGDLGMNGGAPDYPVLSAHTGASSGVFINEGLNNTLDTTGSAEYAGPGVITPTHLFWFSKLGPHYFNGLSFLNEANAQVPGFLTWGSFDGTTNDPIVYPSGTSLKALQAQLFGY